MGIFDIFKKSNDAQVLPEPEAPEPKVKKPRKPRKPKVKIEKVLTEKEKATAAGEPYVNIIKMEVDPNNIHAGAFDLDWNDKFLINLIRAGYKFREDDTDVMIVDRWFQNVCRNVALEMYEQNQADPTNRDVRPISSRDIGNGRTEVS